MASLLSWLGRTAKHVAHDISNDVVAPVQRAVAQINPADQGRTWSHPQPVAPLQGRPAPSAWQQLTHNGASNFVGSIVKPVPQFAEDVANLTYNDVVAPTLKLPHLTPQQTPGIPGAIARFSGATGTPRQALASGLQTALTIGTGGINRGIEGAFTSVAPKVVPRLATRFVANAGTGAVVGAPFNAASYAASNQPFTAKGLGQSLKQGGQAGAVLAGAGTLAEPLLRAGATQAFRGAQAITRENPAITQLKAQKAASIQAMDSASPKMMKQHVANVNNIDRQIQAIQQGGYAKIPGSKEPNIVPPNEHFPVPTLSRMGNGQRVNAQAGGAFSPKGGLQPVQSSSLAEQSRPNRNLEANVSQANYPIKLTNNQPPDLLRPENDSIQRKVERITPEDRQKAQILGISAQRARSLRLRPPVPPELNGPVNERLATMPSPAREIPITPKGIGELPPVQELPAKNRLFSNKVNAIRKIGGEHANMLASKIQNIEADSRAMRAGWMNRIPTIQKLNKHEVTNFYDAVEKKAKPLNDKVAQAVKEWKALTPDIHKTGVHEGLLIGKQENYVPHQYNIEHVKGSTYDSALQWLMNTKQVDHNTAVQLFKDMQAEAARFPNRFGHFESARLTDMPGYQKDKQTLYNYVQGAAQRTAEARHFGLDNQIANKLLDNIRMTGGDVTSATKAVENYLRSADKGIGASALRTARGAFGAARLSKAAISHAGQTSNTAVDTGIGRTLKAWGSYLSRNKDNRDFIAKTGVINPQELHAYQRQFTSVGTAAKEGLSRITAPGLNQTMRVNRSVTALAYRDYARNLAKKGDETGLRSLGVKGKIGKTLTPEQEIQAARGGVDRTMFNPSRATTPIYAETPIGKTVGQYRTAYLYKQTGFVYDRVIKEAGRGNLAPLFRYLTASGAIGYGTVALKNKISGSKEGTGGKALDVLGALGGIPGETAVQAVRYGKKDVTKTVAGIVAPIAGEAVDVGTRLTQALQGKPQQLERYGLGLVPAVGNRLAKALVPYAPGSNKQQVKNGAKQPVPGIYQVKARDGSTKFTTLQGSALKSYKSLNEAKQAQAKNEFKYSKQTSTTINGQQYHKSASGNVYKGAPAPPKLPSTSNTTYDPKTNTWTKVTPSTGKTIKIAADGTETIVNPGIGHLTHARPDYVTNIVTLAKKYNVDPYAALSVAASEGLGGGVGDNGTSFGPFQLHQGGELPQGATQQWAESPAGIEYAMQRISKVAGGLRGQAAINAIVNGFEKPLDPNSEVANASAIYSGKSATLSPDAPRTIRLASGKSGKKGSRSTKGVGSFKFYKGVAYKPTKIRKVTLHNRLASKKPTLKYYKPKETSAASLAKLLSAAYKSA